MANVLNRTTKEFRTSVNTPDFPVADWIINPVLSAAVLAQPTKYWTITGDVVSLQSPAEQLATDDAEIQTLIAATAAEAEFFGDGSDGDQIIAVDTPMPRDFYVGQLIVNPGITLSFPNGCFRIISKKGVIVHGTIDFSGAAAVGATGGAGTPFGTLGSGGAGATGTNAAGVVGTSLNTDALPGYGGDGGAGGAGSSGAGGTGGLVRPNGQLRVRPRRFDTIIEMADTDNGAGAGRRSLFQGGAGGGAGAGGGGGNLGGGGGAGGNVLVIVAPYVFISPTGTIRGNGGAGGNATGGNAGGGGGGGGGVLASVNGFTRNRGTVVVAGGAGGAASGGGAAGAPGAVGKIVNFSVLAA
jgi:hypothetical protein